MPKVGQRYAIPKPEPQPVPPPEPKPEYRLAINVDDANRLTPLLKEKLLAGRLKLGDDCHIRVEVNGKNEGAVEFSCSLVEATTVCDVIRAADRKAGDPPTRVYVSRGESWGRLPGTAELTTMVEGRCVLSRELFRVTVEAAAPVGLDEQEEHEATSEQDQPEALDPFEVAEIVARVQGVEEADLPFEEGSSEQEGPTLLPQYLNEHAPEVPTKAVTFGGDVFTGREASNGSWYNAVVELPKTIGGLISKKHLKLPMVKATPDNGAAADRAITKKRVVPSGTTYQPVARTFVQHYERWKACTRCPLSCQRSQVVLARGTMPCDVLYVGEAPGQSEDAFGVPFVGPAGALLDQIDRQAFEDYPEATRAWTNLVACFPREAKRTSNHQPEPDEIKACAERLQEVVSLCSPRLVVTVGALGEKWFEKSVPSYTGHRTTITHPAAILRQPTVQQGLSAQRAIVTIKTALRKVNQEVRDAGPDFPEARFASQQ